VLHKSRRHTREPTQIALAWLLRRSPIMLPIPGTSSIEHQAERAAASLRLAEEEYEKLSQVPSWQQHGGNEAATYGTTCFWRELATRRCSLLTCNWLRKFGVTRVQVFDMGVQTGIGVAVRLAQAYSK